VFLHRHTKITREKAKLKWGKWIPHFQDNSRLHKVVTNDKIRLTSYREGKHQMAMILPKHQNERTSYINSFQGDICSFLSNDNFEKLLSVTSSKLVNVGTHLFWEGEKADKMYYIHSGQVKLRTSTESGKEFLLGIHNQGSLIGEFAGSDHSSHYSYRAEVTEKAEISVILISDLKKLLYQFGSFAVEFMNWLGYMNRMTQIKLYDVLFFDKSGALASTLLRLSNVYGVKCCDGILINIELTNKELADFIGSTRENVNRTLGAWKREGTIELVNKQIVILQLENLTARCDQHEFN
jgi:CRP/FNR family transcriptional regulator, cyclic AMP receptor protein